MSHHFYEGNVQGEHGQISCDDIKYISRESDWHVKRSYSQLLPVRKLLTFYFKVLFAILCLLLSFNFELYFHNQRLGDRSAARDTGSSNFSKTVSASRQDKVLFEKVR